MGYRRDIGGLRAIAVLPVILFHGGFSAFGGGFLGVDVFFVISGHLTDGRAKLWLAAQSPDQRALEQAILQAEVDHRAGADHPIDHGDCIFSDRALTAAFADRLRRCRAAHGPGLLILGDSHGIDTFQMAALSAGPEAPFIAGLVRGGCRPHDAADNCPYDAALALAAREPGSGAPSCSPRPGSICSRRPRA